MSKTMKFFDRNTYYWYQFKHKMAERVEKVLEIKNTPFTQAIRDGKKVVVKSTINYFGDQSRLSNASKLEFYSPEPGTNLLSDSTIYKGNFLVDENNGDIIFNDQCLAFYVEIYVEGSLIPESIIHDFRRNMANCPICGSKGDDLVFNFYCTNDKCVNFHP